ncbi:hypothetical protein [Streptomyces sp. NPDC058045]|uniref:hypothetical protein n=1 Tax=Streptomyces sp. NPDC058045 TaxID=3346311 RepID=UPI0036E8FB7D
MAERTVEASGGGGRREATAEVRGAQRGVFRAAFTVLRRHGLALTARAARASGAAAVGGLLVTGTAFLLAWPAFTEMRRGAIAAREAEDSYAPDGSLVTDLHLLALAGLPFLILLLHLGCTALQTAAADAVTGGRAGLRSGGRFRRVLGVYGLRGVCVGAPVVLGVFVEAYFTTTTFREYTAIVPKWQYPNLFPVLAYGAPLLGLFGSLLLRFGWTLAPATAALEDLPPLTALRRSWSLTWGSLGAWLRTAGTALPLASLTLGTYLLVQLAVRPLRSATTSLFLTVGPDNTYAAYVAALLVPIAVTLLLTATLTLPTAHATLACLQQRPARERELRSLGATEVVAEEGA